MWLDSEKYTKLLGLEMLMSLMVGVLYIQLLQKEVVYLRQ